jgi:hypothetical protein
MKYEIWNMKYPTLAHFSHFRHFCHFSSLLTNLPSTSVENVRQISSFYAKQTQFTKLQNEHNHFFNNEIRKFKHFVGGKNKPNSKPIQTQTKPILANYKAWQSQNKAKTNPIPSKAKNERFCVDEELYVCF